jgi:hypothetical protein
MLGSSRSVKDPRCCLKGLIFMRTLVIILRGKSMYLAFMHRRLRVATTFRMHWKTDVFENAVKNMTDVMREMTVRCGVGVLGSFR